MENKLIKKLWKEQNRHSAKEYIQMVNRHIGKVLNITNHKGNGNKNHNEISPHTE